MKVVIDIDEAIYKYIKKFDEIPTCENIIYDACIMGVHKGKLIPEHHGLIDRLELSDHIKNRLIQTAMNNMETIIPYSKVCEDIVDNRIDTWIDEVKTIIERSDSE